MKQKPVTAAVVLAAGMSTRMEALKPLLPLGSGTALERVVHSVRKAGVDEVVVVTGYKAEALAPVLDALDVRWAHNPDYERGMFSSVAVGVGALGGEVDAFLVLPVDCALVRPEAISRLFGSQSGGEGQILHPSCCGRRGHPPLISACYRQELCTADEPEGLRGFFGHHLDDEREIEVEDLTILMDMDTPAEHQRLQRFAALLDRPGGDSGERGDWEAASLHGEDALYLLSVLAASEPLMRHSRTVANVGLALAEALKPHTPALDVGLVQRACLLHDLAKGARRHAVVGQRLLENLGLPRLGSLVGFHMVIPPELLGGASLTEEELVYLADKSVIDDRVVSLEERTAKSLERHGEDAEAVSGVQKRMRAATMIRDKVEAVLGIALADVLGAASQSPQW